MRNIFWLNIKTFYTYKIRIFIFVCLLIALSIGVSLLASQLLSGERFFNTVYIGILDLDNSIETHMIISSIDGEEQFEGLIEFITLEENWDFELGELSAAIIFPENFGQAMTTGINKPFTILYNENAPIAASVISIIADAFTDMLRTSQMGIYAAIDFSRQAGISQNEVFLGANMTFLGFILNRTDLFEIELHSISGRVGIWFAYLSAAYIALMICGFFIFTDLTRSKLTPFTIERLKTRNISPIQIYFGTFFAYFVLFTLINIPVFFTQLIWPIFMITFTLSAYGAMVSFLFKNELSSGLFVAIFSVISLFLSGGIVPLNLMSNLQIFSQFTFSYWGVQLLEANFLGENVLAYSLWLLGFTAIFSTIGVIGVAKV